MQKQYGKMGEKSQAVFDKNTVEFVTVAAEYCAFIERSEGMQRKSFVDTLLKVLPLLYIKASMLPECQRIGEEEELEHFVTEDDYEVVRLTVAEVLSGYDDYLDVFVEEMKYSDVPIRKTMSEDLADIYQDLKNFICLFQTGMNETMNDALVECKENFAHYWGQTLVNTMRAMHELKYAGSDDAEKEE